MDETSPAARALLALELVQRVPGITAERLGERLGVTERAARRYIAILREAGLPIESTRGRYGGYRVGRGLRLPPLMFTATEALALVMAVIESHGAADPADPSDPVGSAVGKMVRALPEPLARPVEAVRRVAARRTDPDPPSPKTTVRLVQASDDGRTLRVDYMLGPGRERSMEVDPWAVVVRHGRWYLLCWSHTAAARRVLRLDRIISIEVLDKDFTPPGDLDPMRALEEQLSQGWAHPVEVVIHAPPEAVASWFPRSAGRLEAYGEGQTRLVASTDDPGSYAERLAGMRTPFRVVGSPELVAAVRELGERLLAAADGSITH